MLQLSSPSTISYSKNSLSSSPTQLENRLFPPLCTENLQRYPNIKPCDEILFEISSRLCTHVPFMSSGKDGSSAMEVIALFGYSVASLPGAEWCLAFSSTKSTASHGVFQLEVAGS